MRDNFECSLDIYLLAPIIAVQFRLEIPGISKLFIPD